MGLLVWTLWADEAARAAQISAAQSASTKTADAQRLQSIARDSADDRAALDVLAHTDIISIVDTIDALGGEAGVKLTIGQATPDDASLESVAGSGLHALAFDIEGNGSFGALMKAVALFETMPIPAQLEQLHLARNDNTVAFPWHMSMRAHVYTTASI